MKKTLEKNLAEHAKQLEKLKDNPEAQEAVRKAMEESKRAIEQALKGIEAGGPKAFKFENFAPPGAGGPGGVWQIAPATAGRGVRLGVVPERVPDALAEQLDLSKGQGVLLAQVIKDTPAEKAGLKANDILLSIGGKEVGDPAALSRVLGDLKSGESLDAVVIRKGKKVTVKGVRLADAPKPKAEGKAEAKPSPRAEARPGQPARPARPARPAATAEDGKKTKFNSMTVRIDDGEFNIRATTEDTRYTIQGKVDGGKAVPSSISIRGEDKKTQEYTSLEKVPAEHRAAVAQLLNSVGGGNQ